VACPATAILAVRWSVAKARGGGSVKRSGY
jgi:hypothetical protein